MFSLERTSRWFWKNHYQDYRLRDKEGGLIDVDMVLPKSILKDLPVSSTLRVDFRYFDTEKKEEACFGSDIIVGSNPSNAWLVPSPEETKELLATYKIDAEQALNTSLQLRNFTDTDRIVWHPAWGIEVLQKQNPLKP